MQVEGIRQIYSDIQKALVAMSRTPANYWGEFILDIPIGIFLIYQGLQLSGTHLLAEALVVAVGLFFFSFFEYLFHRWIFHGSIRIMTQGHAAHHQNPLGYDALPFFLPGLLVLVLLGLFRLVMPFNFALLLAGAVDSGYIIYGLSHYLIHHKRFHSPRLRHWARNHLIHHYHADKNFGVTSPLWDVLFKTRYISKTG